MWVNCGRNSRLKEGRIGICEYEMKWKFLVSIE